MEGSPNEYVDAFAEWLPVESLRLFERPQRLDHCNNYVSKRTTRAKGPVFPSGISSGLRTTILLWLRGWKQAGCLFRTRFDVAGVTEFVSSIGLS
jgi:hypothetical protein